MFRIIPVVLVLLAAAYPLTLLFLSTPTVLQIDQPVKVIGVSTPLRVVAVNPHGVRAMRATIEQGGQSYPVFDKEEPARRWAFFRAKENPAIFVIDPGTRQVAGLKEGKARLRLEATANDLRAKTDTVEFDVDVNTQPPLLNVEHEQHHLGLGGSSVVVFSTGGYVTEAGVRAGRYIFRSYPYKDRRICFYAIPYDLPESEEPVLFARNPAGAEAQEKLSGSMKRREWRHRQIEVDEAFLTKVLTELDPQGKGDPVARFTKVNNDMRQANNQAIAELSLQTAPQLLIAGAFKRLGGSAESEFCDYRNYYYRGQSIDQQVHLGTDIAGMSRMPAYSANDGRVVYAAPLGIYGNAVVLDHGYGIQSLYAHLSEFAVKVGQSVKKGDQLGRTGATGMAGGDHLHFSIYVQGVAVNPIEWWDPHWYKDNVLRRLQ